MKLEEIREAAMAHKTFTFDNVIIKELNMSNGVFNLIYSLPSVENKPCCLGLDVKEISLYEPPKYDPCRLFKKGDKVRVVERYGRKFWSAAPETIYTVVADEYLHDDQNVLLRGCVGLNDGKPETLSSWNIPFFHLELVTPVEELEPYYVKETASVYEVFNRNENNSSVAIFFKSQYSIEKAKERAEEECARLNAEYRKEQK